MTIFSFDFLKEIVNGPLSFRLGFIITVGAYLIFVTNAANAVRVKFLAECKKNLEKRENYCFGLNLYHISVNLRTFRVYNFHDSKCVSVKIMTNIRHEAEGYGLKIWSSFSPTSSVTISLSDLQRIMESPFRVAIGNCSHW